MGTPLGWPLPARTWEELKSQVDDRHGRPVLDDDDEIVRDADGDPIVKPPDGTYSRVLEFAFEEYLRTRGPGAAGEEILVDLRDQLGATTNSGRVSDLDDQESVYPNVRVSEVVKDEVRAFADENDMGYGEVAGRAIDEYLDGGAAGRMGRILEALEGDLREAVAELDSTADTDADEGLSLQERQARRAAIRLTGGEGLDGSVTTAEIHDAIAAEVGRSDHHLDTKRPLVKERLNLTRHPIKGEPEYVHVETARKIAADFEIPEEVALPVRDLTPLELEWRVIFGLGRPLVAVDGRYNSATFDEVVEKYLDPDLEAIEEKAVDLVGRIDRWGGVTVDGEGRDATVRLDLQELARHGDKDYNRIKSYAESPADPLPPGEDTDDVVETQLADWTPPADPGTPDAGDAAVASDGGSETDTEAETDEEAEADAEGDPFADLEGEAVTPGDDPLEDEAGLDEDVVDTSRTKEDYRRRLEEGEE